MPLQRTAFVRTLHRRNLTYLPVGTTYVIKTSRSRNPGAFSRVSTPTWWVSERKVEWQWDYELHVTKTEEVDTQRRGFTSRVGREQVKDEEETTEIDWITMRRKQQPKDQAPFVKVDERGFEAPAPAPKETNHMEDVFEMPPPTKEGMSTVDSVTQIGDTFAMPPPLTKENITKDKVPTSDNVTTMGDVFVMPPPQEPIPPKRKNSPADAAKMEELFQMPPPEHDKMVPPPTWKEEELELQQPENPEMLFASDPSPDLGIPRNDQDPTRAWSQKGNVAATRAQQDEIPSFITAKDIHVNVDPDADIDSLLPRDVRRRIPTSNPNPTVSAQVEENENSWHDSFGTPEPHHSPKRYATISIPPLTFTATPSTPLSLLQAHTHSFLALAPAASVDDTTANDEDWNGFDPTPAASVENVFVFLLLPRLSTPFFALASLPSSMLTPSNELKPTEALDFLNRAGTFLPYLRVGRAEGGRLVHASREGVTWEVPGREVGMNVIAALEAVAAKANGSMVEDMLDGVEESNKPEATTVVREEKKAETVNSRMAKRKRRSVGRRMFWAGVWVGGLTGMIGFFGNA
ncbi:hypothetical protein K440DRAFT_643185 [Wilcoxina mikolae CBS 423.85]|nr:hypothetical protein K440DRAFT_643185 [Wilcoxina mikolae CBS 423.85]